MKGLTWGLSEMKIGLTSMLTIAYALLGIDATFAQFKPANDLFYNNGQVYLDSGVVLQIYGNTLTTGPSSLLSNDGEIYVHFDSLYLSTKKGFTIDNDAVVQGDGYYEIEPDWTNNSKFFDESFSRVNLMSDVEQLITGTESTDFYQLVLSGNGVGNDRKKRMTLSARVMDSLSLTTRELATDSFIMRVQSLEPTAISFSTANANRGFVSSLRGDTIFGALERRTANAQVPYIFPVGSSVNPPSGEEYIYRPVDLRPVTDNINVYSVRFVNESPDDQGYDQFSFDDSTCTINPAFYHFINHPSGGDSALIRVYYDYLQDGTYDYLSQWDGTKWNQIITSTFNKGTLYRVGTYWAYFSNDSIPFILSDRIPGLGTITGSADVCANSEKLFLAQGKSNFFQWETTNGMSIVSGQGDDSLILAVLESSGYLKMTPISSSNKCAAPADSIFVIVHPGPQGNFTADHYEGLTSQRINFKDSTLGRPVYWFWQMGDGTTYTSPKFKHQFREVGQYEVRMVVADAYGCPDTVVKFIDIIEGIQVPNVFTPNGDGHNDVFYIPNSGMKEYKFQVFNRWGLLVFETTAPEIAWDGHTSAGNPITEGTYFYVLEARSTSNDYTFKGHLTLLR